MSTSCRQIFGGELEETRLRKINLKKDTVRFTLVQTLSKSNSSTSNIVVLCCGKNGCPE
jgi:hypothetical protein